MNGTFKATGALDIGWSNQSGEKIPLINPLHSSCLGSTTRGHLGNWDLTQPCWRSCAKAHLAVISWASVAWEMSSKVTLYLGTRGFIVQRKCVHFEGLSHAMAQCEKRLKYKILLPNTESQLEINKTQLFSLTPPGPQIIA